VAGVELGLDGRVALVMGSSSGIGLGIASALAREGARVAVVSRSRERAEEAAASVAGVNKGISTGGATAPFVADTDDLDRLAELPGEVEAALGPIEILVTNTGGPPLGGALNHELDHWERAYRSLVLAPRVLAAAVVPGMRERGWGRIVNVGSSSTREPIPGLNLSNSHRMAAVGFLKTLASEVAGDGITVNTVATGRFATERIASNYGSMEAAEAAAERDVPVGRLGLPEEYGDLVAFLCSERAAYVTGTVIPIDGGILRSAF
jgi:3-oxoacyl-[acyl-carrier protein] reductase